MTKTKVRYGIVGYGLFAERAIAPAMTASTKSILVAVQKRSIEQAREKAKALSLPYAFQTAQELVHCPDVDAVFIASANSAHHDEVIAAARAGKHILVEKPMALNTAEAEQMVAECERNNVKLMVGQVLRFSPLVRRVRELVKAGVLGTIVSARADYFYDARLSRRSWLLDRPVAGGRTYLRHRGTLPGHTPVCSRRRSPVRAVDPHPISNVDNNRTIGNSQS